MATNAKRYGLEVEGNLELESRLRRMEVEIQKRTLANPDVIVTARARSTPAQITGISVVGSTPGAVTISWNASTASDLRRYDVEFAEDTSFVTNKQTFRESNTQFQFSTASATGGSGGTTFFARVRAVNSILVAGPFSVILNTTTGEVVSGDIADGAIDTEQLADGAVTGAKTTGLVADLTLPGPPFVAGQASTYLRINSSFSSYTTQIGTLPNLAAGGNINDYLRVTAADTVDYKSGTLPPVAAGGDASKLVRVSAADALAYTAYTFPTAATAQNFIRGNGTNFALQSGTLAPVPGAGDVSSLVRASAADTLAYTSYAFPTAATAKNVIVGGGTDFSLFDQGVQNEAAGTATGGASTNRQGTLAIAGGVKIQWDTVNVLAQTTSTVTLPEAYTGDNYNVVASFAEDPSGATVAEGVAAWVPAAGGSHLTSVVIHNAHDVALDISYISIGSD